MKVIKMNNAGEDHSEWKMVFKTQNPVQADIVAGNLENNGLNVVSINKKDSSYLMFGFIELYVHEDEYDVALKLIEEAENE